MFDEMVYSPCAHSNGELEGRLGQKADGNEIHHPTENVPLARTSHESSEPAS